MVSEMSKFRKNLWIIAFIFYVIGDLITTYFGITNPNIVELNTLADQWFNNGNYVALFLFKMIPFIALFWVDLVILDWLENVAIPIIPLLMITDGISITYDNLMVLQNVGISPELVIITMFAFSLIAIQFAEKHLGYGGITE